MKLGIAIMVASKPIKKAIFSEYEVKNGFARERACAMLRPVSHRKRFRFG
jgi:hypothetical protein